MLSAEAELREAGRAVGVRTELGEEGLVLEVGVVLAEVLLSGRGELEGDLEERDQKRETGQRAVLDDRRVRGKGTMGSMGSARKRTGTYELESSLLESSNDLRQHTT